MDDPDDEVPELVPVLLESDQGAEDGELHADAPVFQAPRRLEKTVPVTLITGFLGAGKSTLVNYILSENHGFRIAVIMNEIGDQKGIEKALLQDEGGGRQRVDEWVELTNGCLCCSVKDDFVNALESLMLQQSVFDYILIETTGLANPGPVAAALWTDEELEAGVVLDCIVTVVDAKHIRRQLSDVPPAAPTPPAPPSTSPPQHGAHAATADANAPGTNAAHGRPVAPNSAATASPHTGETHAAPPVAAAAVNEAQQQVAYADIILLNKTDLVPASELPGVRASLLRHNAAAEVIECRDSRVDLRRILDRGGYKRGALVAAAIGLPPEEAAADAGGAAEVGCEQPGCSGEEGPCGHTHAHTHNHHAHGPHGADAAPAPLSHEPGVTTVTLWLEEPLPLGGVQTWMDTLLWESAAVLDIFRVKGLLCIAGSGRKHGLQAVHELYDVAEGPPWSEGEERCSRIVVIGRRLDRSQLLRSLRAACLPA